MKFGWPVIKYVLVNYGKQIAQYVTSEVKEKVRKKKLQKMEAAYARAKENENNAESASSSEDSLRFYEMAKVYKEEGDFHSKSLNEFESEIESIVEGVIEDVVRKSNDIEFDQLFAIEGKELKASETEILLEDGKKTSNK